MIASAFVAAGGTYWLAPKIDRLNEHNRVYSELVLNRLTSLNDTTRELLKNIAIVHEEKRVKSEISDELRIEIAAQFTELQIRSVELRSFLVDDVHSKHLLKYQKSLLDLKTAYETAETQEDLDLALNKVRDFAAFAAPYEIAISSCRHDQMLPSLLPKMLPNYRGKLQEAKREHRKT